MKLIQMKIPGRPDATLEGYILNDSLTLGQEKARPAVVVCPGGGYVFCTDREAEPVALAYAARGFHAFVLRYSTGWNATGFTPLQELNWVIGYIRENAAQWSIAPDKIAVCGFSAGGYLALASGLMAENKPNAMILGYPATGCPNVPGVDFMLKVLTGKREVTDEDSIPFDLLPKITKEAPPVFLMETAEDVLTPMSALAVANRYNELGLAFELHMFQFGPHGYSLASEECAHGSSQNLDPAFAKWHEMSVLWLHRVFGKLEFVDKSTARMMDFVKDLGLM